MKLVSILRKFLRWLIIAVVLLGLGMIFFAAPDIPLAILKESYASAPSQFVPVQGLQVHLRDEGEGPVVILLHGTSSSLHTWQGWVERLSGRYRLIRIDLPGFGLTGPRPDHDYSVATQVAFLQALADTLALDGFALAGNSLGGRIAWRYALKHSQRVRGLILVDASGYPLEGNVTLAFRLAQVPVLGRLLTVITPRSLVEQSLKDVYADDSRIASELVDRYYELARRPGNREALLVMLSTDWPDDAASPAGINVPTLIMWGAEDSGIPLSHAHRFHEEIAGARLIIYPDAGHVPMEELPAATARDAGAFLQSLDFPAPD